ncbi:MAG: aldehyde dehydrogenase family protein, partial [Alphaproteobacteria bacterium]|nr:aldehyde dehydrogenase family protein [Alphaproteobacteria bacterium]
MLGLHWTSPISKDRPGISDYISIINRFHDTNLPFYKDYMRLCRLKFEQQTIRMNAACKRFQILISVQRSHSAERPMAALGEDFLAFGRSARAYSALIDGKLIGVDQRERLERASPATGRPVSIYPRATDADVQGAIKAARRAADLRRWAAVPGAERSRLILR